MLSLFSFLTLAQTVPSPALPTPSPSPTPTPPARIIPATDEVPPTDRLPPQDTIRQPQDIFSPQAVRPLPGQLDSIPMFNSNSPELVMNEGILLSTFPATGMRFPSVHLNYAFNGRFDFFSHHVSRARTASELRTLFQGALVYNPGSKPVRLEILQGATYLTRPDALYVDLPPMLDDPSGTIHSGPGGRAMNDILRGRRQGGWIPVVDIPPGNTFLLMNLPIPAGVVTPTSNGRSTLLRLRSAGPVHVANMAMFAPRNPDGSERSPTLEEWQNFLINSNVAGPRDTPPSPPRTNGEVIYGRVAGVAIGSEWKATLTDSPKVDYLTIPKRGHSFSYGLSTLHQGTFGTGQIQSAKMVVRYPDTAHEANGNYAIQYSLKLPLYNNTKEPRKVTVLFQTPVKNDRNGGLLFLNPPEDRVFFRGPLRIQYTDDRGASQVRFVHLVQQRGQQGEPLVTLTLQRGERRTVQVDILYPPDSTPPQVLTVQALN